MVSEVSESSKPEVPTVSDHSEVAEKHPLELKLEATTAILDALSQLSRQRKKIEARKPRAGSGKRHMEKWNSECTPIEKGIRDTLVALVSTLRFDIQWWRSEMHIRGLDDEFSEALALLPTMVNELQLPEQETTKKHEPADDRNLPNGTIVDASTGKVISQPKRNQ